LVEQAIYPHKDRVYNVTETYTVNIPNGESVYFDIDIPDSYGYQDVENLIVVGVNQYEILSMDGYQILHGQVDGDENVYTIRIDYKISALSGSIQWDGEVKPEYSYPGQFIDSDNDNIVFETQALIANNEYETAKNIFDYVSGHLKFVDKREGDTRIASKVLEEKDGVCEDYANLMVAMLRAADIPSKSISGMTYRELKKSTDGWEHSASSGSHAWVEFYTGGKWHFADPTWGKGFFDDCDGYHISYGLEPMIEENSYIEKINAIEREGYQIPLSITAPFKVTFWSKSPDVEVTPVVDIALE
jgi:transglutaminase-like putative cysteine protease